MARQIVHPPKGASEQGALLLTRIRGEYLEMPGLRLTPAQARRLWGLDVSECERLLDALVRARFLRRTPDGAYQRES
jgi:DNA-binding IclR family transcriptional regulator